jgi:hypothetical protein
LLLTCRATDLLGAGVMTATIASRQWAGVSPTPKADAQPSWAACPERQDV